MRSGPRPPGVRTLLGVVAVLATTMAVVLALVGIHLGGGDDVVVDVESVAAPSPSTVPPRPTTDPPPAGSSAAASSAAGPSESAPSPSLSRPPDAGGQAESQQPESQQPESQQPESQQNGPGPARSPLADLLGPAYSAVPEEIEARPQPVGLAIDAFDVSMFPVRPVGLAPDGQLEIPDETEIGWYRYGSTAGRPGATVLAAHVSWNRTVGPFAQLGSLEPGGRIDVRLDDGTSRRYEVFERAVYGKLALPRERLWRNTGPETLVLITCGGDFNPELRRYRENIVVYAAPVA